MTLGEELRENLKKLQQGEPKDQDKYLSAAKMVCYGKTVGQAYGILSFAVLCVGPFDRAALASTHSL